MDSARKLAKVETSAVLVVAATRRHGWQRRCWAISVRFAGSWRADSMAPLTGEVPVVDLDLVASAWWPSVVALCHGCQRGWIGWARVTSLDELGREEVHLSAADEPQMGGISLRVV
eukprot:CAMPEP_0115326378 /NCGR_PEP_ID=MMETSP0270-20121206/83540_1 /TAXON_ID=71861 /ORGANISM="Scrippsiella trochoidea, Strain CCMP3099" /LENGTH=115 /DNA_ID=CAMNT_0002746679 /DNA_START=415 /DNA_END=762 /DNA_ORIENTATION=+